MLKSKACLIFVCFFKVNLAVLAVVFQINNSEVSGAVF